MASRPDSFWELPAEEFNAEVERLCRQAWHSRSCPDCGEGVYKTRPIDGTVYVTCLERCGFGFFVAEVKLGPWMPNLRVVA